MYASGMRSVLGTESREFDPPHSDGGLSLVVERRVVDSLARAVLAGGPLDDENPQRELRIGLDTAGRLLEIVVLLMVSEAKT